MISLIKYFKEKAKNVKIIEILTIINTFLGENFSLFLNQKFLKN